MAGSPGGKSAGRVSIRVVPDASKFKLDLKKTLERIEKSTVLNLPLAIETRQAELDIRKFQKKWNGQQIEVDVDAKTALASANLAKFTRRRDVNVDVKLSKASLVKAATLLASLSGGRVAGDWVKELSEGLQNLDKFLPKLAAITLGIGSIGSLALSSIGGIVLMAGSLSSLAALAAPVPGLFAAAGVAGVALYVALKDAKKELKSLSPLWKTLKTTIQDNFWAKAKKPIIDLVRNVFPALRSGLRDVSSSLGTWAASVTRSFQAAFGGSVVTGLMAKLSQGILNSTKGTDAFAASIAALGKFGAQYLPAIGTWFSDISIRFNGWLQNVASNGVLAGWVSNAMIVLGQLGDLVKGVVGTISGLGRAASAAGGGGLKTVADALLAISAAVNSPGFQSTLTTIFTGAAAGAHALGSVLGPIGSMLKTLAPSLSAVLSGAGVGASQLISGAADALGQPGFGKGLEDFIAGLLDGIHGLLPALGPVGKALGSLATFAGKLGAQLGPVLGATFSELAPILADVLRELEPLIPVLGGALVKAIKELGPALGDFVTNTLPGLVETIKIILPPLSKLVSGLAHVVGWAAKLAEPIQAGAKAFEDLRRGTTSLGGILGEALSGGFGSLTKSIATFFYNGGGMLRDFVTNTVGMFADFGTNSLGMFSDFFTNTLGMFSDFFTVNLPQAITGALAGLGQIFVQLGRNLLQNLATGIAVGVVGIHYLFTQFPTDFVNWLAGAGAWLVTTGQNILAGLFNGILAGYNFVAGWFAAMPGRVLGFLAAAGSWLVGTGISMLQGLAAGISAGYSAVVGFFTALPGRILGFVAGAGAWLVSMGVNLLHGAASGASSGASSLWSFIKGLPGQIIGFFTGAPGWLFNAGQNIVQGLLRGVRSLAGTVGSFFLSLLPGWIVGPFKAALGINSPSKVFAGYGENIVQGLVGGISSQQSALDRTMSGIVSVPGGGPGTAQTAQAIAASRSASGGATQAASHNFNIYEVTDPVGTAMAVARRQQMLGA